MKFFSLVLFALASSPSAFATSPFPRPSLQCDSADGNFRLDVHESLALIRVYDNGQSTFSHSIRGLDFKTDGKIITAINNTNENPDLPTGVIFRADLAKLKDNAFSLDDVSGHQTTWSCYKP